MIFTLADLKKLRWHLAAFFVLLLVAVLIATQSLALRERAHRERESAERSSRQIEERLRLVRTEELEIKEKSAVLVAMRNSGMIGDERRLDWTELLRTSQERLGIPEASYEIGPQTLLDGPGSTGVRYFASPMKLRLRLLHEEDLLRSLDALRAGASALIVVRSCTLSRSSQGSASLAEAVCDLEWITAQIARPANEERR